ncbi:MAG: glycosyltransferase [Ignavibacteria bacterium]|jgi:glycosyltransferase involved in cell wall biosynthesis
MIRYSIIIPVLNEEKNLPKLFQNLNTFDEAKEIIVVDGGSNDKSVVLARTYKVKVYKGVRGRGKQLNLGAEKAVGEITILPSNA